MIPLVVGSGKSDKNPKKTNDGIDNTENIIYVLKIIR